MCRAKIFMLVAVLACVWAPVMRAGTALDKLGDFFGGKDREASRSDEILDPEQAFILSAEASGSGEITVRWDITKGYYLYRDRFRFSVDPAVAALKAVSLPAGEAVKDPEFGQVEVYRHSASIKLG